MSTIEPTVTDIHMCQSIRGPLMNWERREWIEATGYIKKNDGTPYASWRELKEAFCDELKQGHEVVPIGDCDNFDFEKGCRGHIRPAVRAGACPGCVSRSTDTCQHTCVKEGE